MSELTKKSIVNQGLPPSTQNDSDPIELAKGDVSLPALRADRVSQEVRTHFKTAGKDEKDSEQPKRNRVVQIVAMKTQADAVKPGLTPIINGRVSSIGQGHS